MRKITFLILILIFTTSCSTTKKTTNLSKEQPVTIENEELEYKIIIFDTGFNSYLATIAKPMNYYSESFLENKNRFYVTTWNIRASNPLQYNADIYENIINYDLNIHYGLEVNYKLYNYFRFVEYKYNEKF